MPFTDPDQRTIVILIIGAVLAGLIRLVTFGAQLRSVRPTVVEVAAEALGAAVAAFLFGAVVTLFYTIPPEFYWGFSGLAGLLGGRFVLIAAILVEKRLGLKGIGEALSGEVGSITSRNVEKAERKERDRER